MSDKERNTPPNRESLDNGLRVEGVQSGETGILGAENSKETGSVDQIREHASGIRTPQSDEQGNTILKEQQGDLSADSEKQESTESRRSLVVELASHLCERRPNFHESTQFIGRCRKRYRAARF